MTQSGFAADKKHFMNTFCGANTSKELRGEKGNVKSET